MARGTCFLTPAHVRRSSAIRRSGSTSPLGFARASPSPPSHAEHGATLARKFSLGGGRPYTPSPQGEPERRWWAQPLNSGRTGGVRGRGGGIPSPPAALTLANPFPQVGTIPERLGWSGVPSPQGAEMRGGRSPRPGRCSPTLSMSADLGRGTGPPPTDRPHLGWCRIPDLTAFTLQVKGR